MHAKDDLSRFYCQREQCADFGKPNAGNLSVCDRYGPDKERRLLYCKTCKKRFSERKGTVFFGSRLPDDKILSVLNYFGESCGVRKTSRLTGVNKNTVMRYSKRAGEYAKNLHEELVAFFRTDA